jgi:NIPSNAP
MQRRTFLQAGLATLGVTAGAVRLEAAETSPIDIYQLRTVAIRPGKQPVFDDYLSRALIPAVKRAGAGPVGVFTESGDNDLRKTYVLIVHPSADSAVTLRQKLGGDGEFQSAAKDYMAAKPTDKVYEHAESTLLAAIAGMPRLQKPDTSKPRIVNLRIYRSHNERAAAKKVEMFNTGELAIFRRTGLMPVFFGSAIAGPDLPNLTYMLVFPDDASRTAAWSRFGKDSEWQKLKSIPEFADKEIISGITNLVLTPTAYSEI